MSKVKKRILVGVAVLVVVFFVGSFAADRYMLGQTFARFGGRGVNAIATFDGYYAKDHTRTPVEFQMDGKTLRGYIYGEDNNDKGLVVFRHGIYSQHQDYLLLIEALVDRGWKVFAYDAIGCGLSDGDSTIGFPQSALDVHRALEFVDESGLAGDLPVVIMGHSWGGFGVAAALNFHDDVKACVTMSGFADSMGIVMDASRAMMGPLAVTQAPTIWLNHKIDFGQYSDISAVDGINGAGIPVLVVHGTGDTVVGYDTTGIIAQRDKITNPQVEYAVMDDPARNGHNTYFNAPDTQVYLNELSAKLADLQQQYGDDIPEDVLADFLAGIDYKRANTPDPYLIDTIDDFLTRAIGK